MTNTEAMAALREAKTAPQASALVRKMDKAYRTKHAMEIKTIVMALAR